MERKENIRQIEKCFVTEVPRITFCHKAALYMLHMPCGQEHGEGAALS